MNVLGIIFSYSGRANLRELTKKRTLASLPLGGKYRIVDYILSNYVNSGVEDVSIITRNNYHSLIDHLESGKEWDLTRKRGGLRVLTPLAGSASTASDGGIYRGVVDALAQNMHSIKRSIADYVIISGSSFIYNLDLEVLLKHHTDSRADVTAVYTKNINSKQLAPMGASVFHLDQDGRIQDMTMNMDDMNPQEANVSMELYVIKKSLLESIVADAMAYQQYDLYEGIFKRLSHALVFKGYEHKEQVLEVSSVSSYMKANMSLLDKHVRSAVYSQPIYTKIKDSVPALYCQGSNVSNSIISDGCIIEGTVENCILSRGVKIGKGSVVKNSIIMQNVEIMKDVSLNHVILDKDVIVRDHRELSGHETYPVLVEKASII